MPYVTKFFHHVTERIPHPESHSEEECHKYFERMVNEWGGRVVAMCGSQMPGDGIHVMMACEKWVPRL